MARYIDADALDARMYHDAFETDSDMQKWDGGCWIRYKMFENAIGDALTAEVQEVRRGKWEKSYADHEAFGVRPFCRYCSECHEITVFPYKYCPNCGALMEE